MGAIHAYRRVFANPALARLLLGEFVSSIGDWLYLVALLVVVFQRSESAALLGVVGAARVVPYVVLSVPAGIVVDRYDRRLILMVTDVARGVVMLVLALLVTIEAPLVFIVAMTLLAASFSTFFGPAIGAFLPTLVRDESELGPANSAWASLDNLGFVIGPALGGLLIAAGGLTMAFLINALTFGVVAIVLWRLPSSAGTAPRGATAAPSEGAQAPIPDAPGVRDAFRGLIRPLAGLTLVNGVGGFVLGGVSVLTVVIAVDVLQQGEAATGYLNAAIGVGGLIGAAGSAALVMRGGLTAPLVAGGIVLAAGLAVLGLSGTLGVALIAMAVASAGSLVVDVVSTTLFQRTVPDALRGRALGAMSTVAIGLYAAGSLLVPIAAGVVGVLPALIGCAIAVAVGVGAGALLVATSGVSVPPLDPDRATLLRVPAFSGLPATRLEEAARRAAVQPTAAGEVVLRQGEPADRFYVITSGEYVVTQQGAPDAAPVELNRMGEEEAFGEIGLLSGVPRTATVMSVTDGVLLALDASTFADLVAAAPGLSSRMLEMHRPAAAPT